MGKIKGDDMSKDSGWIMVEGKKCRIICNGEGGPAVLLGTFPLDTDDSEHIFKRINDLSRNKAFLLSVYQVSDWGKDFSPYPARNALDGSEFSGGGKETLTWLSGSLIPYIKERYKTDGIYTAGYSLSGLFALWSLYNMDTLSGAACCSGSLWYDGWDRFMEENRVKGKDLTVYLSLGTKEEKTRNPVVSMVGDRTRQQEKMLLNEPSVSHVTLEWNQGGHFADSAERLAKGISWLIETLTASSSHDQ